jgi:energy-converting hydrogenase Eha subunit A
MDDHDLVLKHLCLWFVKMGSPPREKDTIIFFGFSTHAALPQPWDAQRVEAIAMKMIGESLCAQPPSCLGSATKPTKRALDNIVLAA